MLLEACVIRLPDHLELLSAIHPIASLREGTLLLAELDIARCCWFAQFGEQSRLPGDSSPTVRQRRLMVTAAISGLIDVDAVTPSVGRMVAALALKALPAYALMALVGAGAALALR
jgi:hypothetical protein